ncbi:MAG: TraB/GumN family protein [Bacteroidota bacterium]
MKKKKYKNQSLLWQLHSEHTPTPSYIFGTMHIKNSNLFSHLEKAYAAIDEVEIYAAEYDLHDAQEGLSPMLFQLPDGKALPDYIEKKKFQKLQNIIQKAFDIDLYQIQHLLPIFIVNILTQKILAQNSNASLDEHLWNYALTQGKNCTGVERFQEQIDILQKIEVKEQINMLLKIGQNVSKYRKKLLHLSEIYQKGNMQLLYQLSKKSSGKLRKMMIYNRNEIMASRIADFAKETTIFAAVGAAHLGGEKGALRYLKQKGFSVKPIIL